MQGGHDNNKYVLCFSQITRERVFFRNYSKLQFDN